jgi:hypothetical protein
MAGTEPPASALRCAQVGGPYRRLGKTQGKDTGLETRHY